MADDLSLGIDKRDMRRAFERAAPGYDAAAVLQQEVARRMLERLDFVKLAPKRVLDAGCGTGFALSDLARRYPAAELVALDIAHAMLQVARAQVPWWRRTLPMLGGVPRRYVCGDLDALPLPAGSVDLLWSSLAMQWSNDLSRTFAESYRVLAPGGLLMFSTFGPDTLKELRQAFAGVDGHTHVNRFVDMHDIGDQLAYAGFAAPVMDMEFITLTYADVRALLRELKAIGAHNVTTGRSHGLMGKQRWQAMLARYEQLRREGRLPATFEIIYGHAWVGEQKRQHLDDGRQVIQWQIDQRRSGMR
jgi:malonyl-CoA O-methyltransferase